MILSMSSRPALTRGLTLVELLVATTIGLFLMGGVVAVMVDNKNNFVFEQAVAEMQENARFVDDELTHEIRMAGYIGCNADAIYTNTLGEVDSNNIASISPNDWMNSQYGVRGYEDSQTLLLPAFSDLKAGTDVLVINRGDPYESIDVVAHSPSTAEITTAGLHGFVSDDILLISDSLCSKVTVFQASAAGGASISHDSGGSNCRRALSTSVGYNCNINTPSSGAVGEAYSEHSTLMKYKTSAYFVKASEITGLPTLYRVTRGPGGVLDTQELVSGAEDFQVLYGFGNSGSQRVSRYLSADAVEALGADWNHVVAVRATIIMKSQREVMPVASDVDLGGGYDAATYSYLADTRHAFQKVTVTGRVRNSNVRNIQENP